MRSVPPDQVGPYPPSYMPTKHISYRLEKVIVLKCVGGVSASLTNEALPSQLVDTLLVYLVVITRSVKPLLPVMSRWHIQLSRQLVSTRSKVRILPVHLLSGSVRAAVSHLTQWEAPGSIGQPFSSPNPSDSVPTFYSLSISLRL